MVKVKVLSSCLLLVSTSVSALDASVWEGGEKWMKDPTQTSTNDDAIPNQGPKYTLKHSRKLTSSAAGLVGEIVAIPFQTVPPGFLECDGQALNRDDYPDLYDAIRDLYGLGSVINTFKIPDYRGYALRALDSGAGIDPGRVLGSKQEDMFKTHFHIVPRDHRTPGSIDAMGAGSESGGTADNDGISDGNFPFKTLRNSDGGGIETRMKNVAVKFVIRAFPVNDIAQSGVNTLQVCDADGKNCFEPNQITQTLTQMSLISSDLNSLKTKMGNVETQISSLQSWRIPVNTKLDDLSSHGEAWDAKLLDTHTRVSKNEIDIATLEGDVDSIQDSIKQIVPENLHDTDNTLTEMQKQIDMAIYWLVVLTVVIAVRLILDVVSYFKEILVKERLSPVVQPSAQINQQPYYQPNRHFKLENAVVVEQYPEIEVM